MKAKSIPESRLPDLSLPEDLQHPINRLRGIDNYCETLMSERGGYRESTTELRNCEDGARIALEMARRKVAERGEGDPLADLYHRECARLVRIRSDFCEQHFRRLCDLANAMRLAMPDLLLKCKVIALHPARLDRRDNGTDWEAFKSELKAVQLEACRLLDEKAKPKGPGTNEATLTKGHLALTLLFANPSWTDKQIAKAAGMSRTSLYRNSRFKNARQAQRTGRVLDNQLHQNPRRSSRIAVEEHRRENAE